MSLRMKMLLGFMIPAIMLVTAGVWSSSRMRSIGKEVGDMLDDNDRSIQYAMRMSEAMERMDSAVLLRMQGDENSFLRITASEPVAFAEALRLAKGNITVPGEGAVLDSISYYSDRFLGMIKTDDSLLSMDIYRIQIFPSFEKAQHFISELRRLNSDAMYSTAQKVVDRANRAALPGDLIVLSAIIFSLLFAWLTQLYVVNPIKSVLKAVREWRETGLFKAPEINTNDELRDLINELYAASARQSKPNDK
jgi:methyl-accepting chemotaxis protein